MAVQSDAKTAINQILNDVGIHIVRSGGRPFGIMVPDGHTQAVGE